MRTSTGVQGAGEAKGGAPPRGAPFFCLTLEGPLLRTYYLSNALDQLARLQLARVGSIAVHAA